MCICEISDPYPPPGPVYLAHFRVRGEGPPAAPTSSSLRIARPHILWFVFLRRSTLNPARSGPQLFCAGLSANAWQFRQDLCFCSKLQQRHYHKIRERLPPPEHQIPAPREPASRDFQYRHRENLGSGSGSPQEVPCLRYSDHGCRRTIMICWVWGHGCQQTIYVCMVV